MNIQIILKDLHGNNELQTIPARNGINQHNHILTERLQI